MPSCSSRALMIAVCAQLVVALTAMGTELEIKNWTWSITPGSQTASATVEIENNSSSGYSGSIGLFLELSTEPIGKSGVSYSLVSEGALPQLAAGLSRQHYISGDFSHLSIPDGRYYVVIILAEYTTAGVYYAIDGETATEKWTVGNPPPEETSTPSDDVNTVPTAASCGVSSASEIAMLFSPVAALPLARFRRRIRAPISPSAPAPHSSRCPAGIVSIPDRRQCIGWTRDR